MVLPKRLQSVLKNNYLNLSVQYVMVIWLGCMQLMQLYLKLKASTQRIKVPKHNKHLSTRKWKKQRELVFRTKGHDCYICGEWADAVDHVIPRKRGGSDDLSNLSPICRACNSRKGSRDYAVFLGRTPTPPVFPSNLSRVQTSVVHHSPFSTDSSQS